MLLGFRGNWACGEQALGSKLFECDDQARARLL
jgi:hypothetical protein